MRNHIFRGIGLPLTAPSGGVVSGVAIKIGALVVVPSTTAAEGETFNGDTEGCFELAAATSQTWSELALLYWDNTNKVFTTTASGNTKAGVAIAAKISAAATGQVKLIQTL